MLLKQKLTGTLRRADHFPASGTAESTVHAPWLSQSPGCFLTNRILSILAITNNTASPCFRWSWTLARLHSLSGLSVASQKLNTGAHYRIWRVAAMVRFLVFCPNPGLNPQSVPGRSSNTLSWCGGVVIRARRESAINMRLIHRSMTWSFELLAGTIMAAGGLAFVVGLGWVLGHL